MIKPIIYVIICLICWMVGNYVLQAMITGLMILAGIIFLAESIKPLRWIVYKTIGFIDIIAFVFGIYAMLAFGFTMALGITIAGLGITLAYRPYVNSKKKTT